MSNASNSTWNKGWEMFLNRSTATIVIETSVMLLMGVIAIAGNLLVFISIYRNPSLRTIANYFVLSLAMTDLLNAMLCLPPSLLWFVESRYETGQELCDFQAIINTTLILVSVGTMALMAVNRFVCVCQSSKYKKTFNKKTSLVMIGTLWVTSLTFITLVVEEAREVVQVAFLPQTIVCGFIYRPQKLHSAILVNLFVVVMLAVPFVTIAYCYFKVFRKIREHKKNIAPSSNSSNLGTSVQEIKATRILFAVLMGYVFTWVPALIVTLANNITGGVNDLPREAHIIITYTVSSSSAINPVIYGAMNMAFRQEYLKIFGCR